MITPSKLTPVSRFVAAFGMLPSSYKEAMTYEEQLVWLCNYLETEILPAINNNADGLAELQNLYVALKDYVDNYFDNLDVQEEINNKLDDMVEAGTLQEIITEYLQVKGLLVYNTKAEMKTATNLIDGSFAKTYGNTDYKDGDGYFYKIREIINQDIVDDDNIIALYDENLVAEKIPEARLNELNLAINTTNTNINNYITEENNKKVLHKTKPVKFNSLNDGIAINGANYYYDRNLTSKSNSLPMISLTNQTTTFPVVQGTAVWNKTGQIFYVNSEEIFTMSYTNKPTKTTIFSDNFGHGGDACIFEDNMYIVDSDNNNIYKVNLQTGTKTTYELTDSDVTNEDHPTYVPKIAGVCMNNSDYAYICVCDDESYSAETGHKIQDGSTIRVYKFMFSDSSVEKLFELEQDIVYVQGMTKDKDYFYIIGNKEFVSNYTGSKLHIINLDDFTIYDTLENSNNEEFEGIDYGCTRGYKGIFTTCGRSGVSIQYGVLSFDSNYTVAYEKTNDASKKIIYMRRNGLCIANMYVTGSFTAGSTVTIDNVFDNLPKIFAGPLIANSIPVVAVSYTGQSRNYRAQIKFDLNDNSLDVLTATGSQDSTYVTITFVYPCM